MAASLRVVQPEERDGYRIILPKQAEPLVMHVSGADECPRCSLPEFNWLECTCGLFCRVRLNCNGLR